MSLNHRILNPKEKIAEDWIEEFVKDMAPMQEMQLNMVDRRTIKQIAKRMVKKGWIKREAE